VLCALGLAAAATRRDVARTVMLSGATLARGPLDAAREQLCVAAADALGESSRRLRVSAEMRYRGQSFELAVDASPERGPDELCEAFAAAHEQRYGYRDDEGEVELVTLRVCAFGAAPEADLGLTRVGAPDRAHGSVVFMGERLEASHLVGELPSGMGVHGPAVCALPEATVFVPPGWAGVVDTQGTLILERHAT
jgi:N-methylhydantoinase A